MQQLFKDKVVVITGGSSGIGRALAVEFKTAGAKIAVCGRNLQALERMQEEMNYENLFTFRADVSVQEDCKNFIAATLEHFGSIEVLVNNAGLSMRALFKDLEDLSVLKKLMDINFYGTVYCTYYAMPAILRSRGTIIGVSSIAGYRGLPGRTGYSASKFAMQGFLEALRTENLHTGVHVTWVSPGFTASNIRNTALNKSGQAQGETPLEEDKLMSAEQVAKSILLAVSKRKRTLVLTTQGKLTVWISKLFPAWADKLIYDHFKKEPGSPLQ
ncbi:MAG TPA: SDR family oxidoreductase [Chitinophagaceae bacterium]